MLGRLAISFRVYLPALGWYRQTPCQLYRGSEDLNSGFYAYTTGTFMTESSLQPTVSILGSCQHYPQLKYEVNHYVLNLNVKCSHMLACLETWSTADGYYFGRLWNTLGYRAYQTHLLMLTA